MDISKLPVHLLDTIHLDAILLSKLERNNWEKVHQELLKERPILSLQTQYDFPHCFDIELEYYFADRLPKLEKISTYQEDNMINDYEYLEAIYNLLTI